MASKMADREAEGTPRFYERTYDDLKAKRDTLLRQVADMNPILEGLERVMKKSGPAAAKPTRRRRSRSTAHRVQHVREGLEGQYSKMELIDAAAHCLSVAGPQTNKNLADLMLAGGVRTKAKNFPATLHATLSRDKAARLGIGKENGKWFIRK
jgi:hypothetical protein